MKHQFESVLGKAGLSIEDLSTAGKKYLSDMRKLEAAIPLLEADLKKPNLSVSKKEEYESGLADAKDAIRELDTKFCKFLDSWIPNRAKMAENGKRLQEAQTAKKAAAAGSAAPAAAAPAKVNTSTAPAQTPAKTEPAKPAKTETPAADGKKTNWLGIVIGVALTAGLGVAGWQIYKGWQARRA